MTIIKNNLKIPLKKIALLALSIIVLIGGIIVLYIYSGVSNQAPGTRPSLQKYADQVLAKCATVGYRPSCYDEEIPKLMTSLSMEEAFGVADIIQKTDSAYGYCHILGHKLGGKEALKDLNKWTEIIPRCPSGICSNGCLHGAAIERFRNDVLTDTQIEIAKEQLRVACESTERWGPSGLEKAECYHGVGHLTVYITGANIRKSLEICDTIFTDKNRAGSKSLCYEGAFMSLFQPLEPEDVALVQGLSPKKEDLRTFCEEFGNSQKTEACWQEGWPLFQEEIMTPAGIVKYCSLSASDYDRRHCYTMLFYVNAQGTAYDHLKLKNLCGSLPPPLKEGCFGDMANAIIHGGFKNIDSAITFCSLSEELPVEQFCYQRVAEVAGYNIARNSEKFLKLCQKLPPDFQQKCLRGDARPLE